MSICREVKENKNQKQKEGRKGGRDGGGGMEAGKETVGNSTSAHDSGSEAAG